MKQGGSGAVRRHPEEAAGSTVARFRARFRAHLERSRLIEPADTVLVAVSGGVDSVVLLELLRFGLGDRAPAPRCRALRPRNAAGQRSGRGMGRRPVRRVGRAAGAGARRAAAALPGGGARSAVPLPARGGRPRRRATGSRQRTTPMTRRRPSCSASSAAPACAASPGFRSGGAASFARCSRSAGRSWRRTRGRWACATARTPPILPELRAQPPAPRGAAAPRAHRARRRRGARPFGARGACCGECVGVAPG